jgi:hypothetical protein
VHIGACTLADPAPSAVAGSTALVVVQVRPSSVFVSPVSHFEQLRDRHGNISAGGAGVLRARLLDAPEGSDACRVMDRRDGTWAVAFVPTRAGAVQLAVELNEAPLAGSPYTIDVQPGAPAPSRLCGAIRMLTCSQAPRIRHTAASRSRAASCGRALASRPASLCARATASATHAQLAATRLARGRWAARRAP